MDNEACAPRAIIVRGACVHNLKHVNVDVPLHGITAIAGVSGSGKSSLALGVLYSEGSRRYLEALSAYTRRRLTQAPVADVEELLHVPAALALRQRPAIPGIRSTFGTGTELLNSLRLMFSRLGSHRCPNGHYLEPSMNVALEKPLVCPVCGVNFFGPSAEELSFNSLGACSRCSGTGIVRAVNMASLVPDDSLSIDEGAVAPWRSLMWSLMTDVCRAMGVRTNVPFRELTEKERDIVFHGPPDKKHIFYKAKNSDLATELDFTFYNAVRTVENALAKVKDEKGMKRVAKFLSEQPCPACHGTRLSEAARASRFGGLDLGQATAMTLDAIAPWLEKSATHVPLALRAMAADINGSFKNTARRLLELGLGYLTLDRAAETLSTGERQRMQLARAVRNRTTGVLYVLDEPSIGLHPHNLAGVAGIMADLVADGNSIVLVDHDTELLGCASWIIEMGPGAGAKGGDVIAQGQPEQIGANPDSLIGPFLSGKASLMARAPAPEKDIFRYGRIDISTKAIHTVQPLEAQIPRGRLTVVTGVSGSGKTTLILDSLAPALMALNKGDPLPSHVKAISADGISRVKLIDAAPIGVNVRSTVATYADVHDQLRKIFARSPEAKKLGLKAGDFSYNTGSLRCPVCDGCGVISLDVQFLPDVDITCPECHGTRYAKKADLIACLDAVGIPRAMPQIMGMDINGALEACANWQSIADRLSTLQNIGLGYLTLGEATPGLSGGEAQRLKLASEMGKSQADALFIFDEPTIGLHPLDVRTLLSVFQKLLDQGATVVVIEHDTTIMRNADYIIDLGPGGGGAGGRIVARGTPADIAANPASITGKYLASSRKSACAKNSLNPD